MDARSAADQQIEESLDLARRGDQRGFTALYSALSGKVSGFVRAKGVTDVAEVVNDVFLGAFTGLPSFIGAAPHFRAWLFTIAWNKTADWHRAEARRSAIGVTVPAEEMHFVGGDVELEALASLDTEVMSTLACLTPEQRDVVLLRVVADLSLEQTAEAMGRPVGAIKALQHRALERLRRNLTEPVSRERGSAMTGLR